MSGLDYNEMRKTNERWLESPDPTVRAGARRVLALLDEVARLTRERDGMMDAVERLNASIERQSERLRVVEQERDEWKERLLAQPLVCDLQAAEAVCDQLREALERISVLDGANAPSRSTTVEYLRSIARAALARLGERAKEEK